MTTKTFNGITFHQCEQSEFAHSWNDGAEGDGYWTYIVHGNLSHWILVYSRDKENPVLEPRLSPKFKPAPFYHCPWCGVKLGRPAIPTDLKAFAAGSK